MNRKRHIILLLIALSAWFVFYLIGLPSKYFQKWSTESQILLSLVTVFAIIPLIAFVTLILIGNHYVKVSKWFAFYASLPLAIIDFIICGIIQKKGLYVFISHWYITIGYFYVWIIIPIVGFTIEKFEKRVRNEE